MPWEHAIIGYITYSLLVHLLYHDSPTGIETLVVVFASLLPDLLDKPLAWQFGVFADSGGYAIFHSVFFVVPLSIGGLMFAYYRDQSRIGWAFGIGYVFHLPADVIPRTVERIKDGQLDLEKVLWPVQTYGGESPESFVGGSMHYLVVFAEQVYGAEPTMFLQAIFGLTVFAFLLWIYDGMPVVREVFNSIRRTLPTQKSRSD